MASSVDVIAVRIFQWLVHRPWVVVAVGLLVVALAASRLPLLVKDVRPDAFLAPHNPSLVYRDIVKDIFGLSDPLVLAVVAEGGNGVFTPENLQFVQGLSEQVSNLPNVNSARLVSLATENNIQSSTAGMEIVPFLEVMPTTVDEAQLIRQQIKKFPLYEGNLVSSDGQATLIIAEMINEDLAEVSYQRLLQLVAESSVPDKVSVHIAGEGAVSGYMGRYLDADGKRLVPFAALAITMILIIAYRRLSPALMCNLVMIATIVITMGVMAAQEVPFYIITAALPVILIGISVADGIHIYSHYFDLQEKQQRLFPQRGNTTADCDDLVVETMLGMWRPITLTSLTTAVGFIGLYLAATMPPFKYFGLFAALGVGVAWLYSMVFLPALMALTKPKSKLKAEVVGSAPAKFMSSLGQFTLGHSNFILAAFLAVFAAGTLSALQLKVDDDPITIFHPNEPIAIADRVINQYTNGSNTLDIVVETDATEALFDPILLKKIEALQSYIASLPHVGASVSIVDYLKQMNKAMNEGDPAFYKLPETKEMVAQYFLVYAALSDPTDFEQQVDYDYRMANIRVQLDSGGYQDTRPVLVAIQSYIAENFNDDEISATLSGRVNLNYHWIKDLAGSHFTGVMITLALVWTVSSLLFRSEIAGLYTLIPVAGAVLGVYAIMVLTGITLGMGTTMFAAIAIGLGIDFAIHTLDRITVLIEKNNGDMADAFSEFYPTTGKALLFNFLAIACGFGVLLASNIMSLISFGGIVMLSIGISFIASMTLLPAMIWRFRPDFLFHKSVSSSVVNTRILIIASVAVGAIFFSLPAPAATQSKLSAIELVQKVNQVEQGELVTRNLSMEMTDRRGKIRRRETISYRRDFDRQKKTILFYLTPANVRDTAFLTWDYAEADKEDDQWLYLPALRKVRRISAANRGDYFLGTDFTYDDIKQDGKLSTSDFYYSLNENGETGSQESADFEVFFLESLPKTQKIAEELGYSRTVVSIDARNWVVLGVEFWDVKGVYLKTLHVSDVRKVDGIWTRHVLTMENHQTGHKTEIMFSNVDYKTPLKSNLFTKQSLTRGH
jgi:predicted RND superfamily exporter protein/outer membrane lipoprotein-sorting protein